MSKHVEITVHAIAEDGLPDMDALVGRVAFVFDGDIVGGWPLGPEPDHDPRDGYIGAWEADSDVGKHGQFRGVTHWVEFPVPIWELEREQP